MTGPATICGKPTKRGTSCRSQVHSWLDGLSVQRADGCWTHMSPAFREATEKRKRDDEAAWRAYLDADPICWDWPTPDTLPVSELSEAQASELLALWQNGRCAICGHHHDFIEDHDHATGMVRGYLCRSCNIKEGIYLDPDCLFGRYRERHPTKMLSLEIRYWDPIAKDYARPIPRGREADKWTDAASEDIGL